MNASGSWLVNTTAARMARFTTTKAAGTRARAPCTGDSARSDNSRRKSSVSASALTNTASAALAPNVDSMNPVVQSHFAATMRIGGAAKLVNVPPTETLTNNTPSVAYLRRLDAWVAKMRSRSISAASVIAAGSVMNEPSSGTSERLRKYPAIAGCAGSSRATERTPSDASCMIGLLAAIDHDHEDEHRLDEVPAVQVGGRSAPAIGEGHEQEQDEGPEAENGFDLAQQVPQPRVRGARVRQVLEVAGGEGVQDRQREQRERRRIQEFRLGQSCSQSTVARAEARKSQSLVRKSTYLPCAQRASQDTDLPMKLLRYLRDAAVFAPCYVVLDWASYIDPVGPFNITPWNPQPALAIVWMMLGGLVHAPAVLATIVLADMLVRHAPGGYAITTTTALVLASGYAAIAWALKSLLKRHRPAFDPAAHDLRRRSWWPAAGVVGAAFIGVLSASGLLAGTGVRQGLAALLDRRRGRHPGDRAAAVRRRRRRTAISPSHALAPAGGYVAGDRAGGHRLADIRGIRQRSVAAVLSAVLASHLDRDSLRHERRHPGHRHRPDGGRAWHPQQAIKSRCLSSNCRPCWWP